LAPTPVDEKICLMILNWNKNVEKVIIRSIWGECSSNSMNNSFCSCSRRMDSAITFHWFHRPSVCWRKMKPIFSGWNIPFRKMKMFSGWWIKSFRLNFLYRKLKCFGEEIFLAGKINKITEI
jgi:hypothetical protein